MSARGALAGAAQRASRFGVRPQRNRLTAPETRRIL
jgi:hypothetical protein